MKPLLALFLGWMACLPAMAAGPDLAEALRAMPLPAQTRINRDNAIDVILDTFQSNRVVKAILFLPGVADDFYLIDRDAPPLNLGATNLFEAITALTNATAVRAIFQEPFLLLHVSRDTLSPACVAEEARVAGILRKENHLPHACWKDAHWERIQPIMERQFGRPVRPAGPSADGWHFSRHNLAAWGLSDWEFLNALSLAGGTRVTVQKRGIIVEVRGTL